MWIIPLSRRRAAALALGLAAVGFSAGARAGVQPFDPAAFDKALAAGQPVAVHFHAAWCGTCKAQEPVVAQLMAQPRFAAMNLFVADYDQSKALKQQLKVNSQSTFVVFKAGREVARSTGQTSAEAIAQTLGKAL